MFSHTSLFKPCWMTGSSLPLHSPLFSLQLNLNLFHLSPLPVQEGIQGNHTGHTGRVTWPNSTLMWVLHLSYHHFLGKNTFLGSRKITIFQCLPLEWPLCQAVGWTESGRPGMRMEKPLSFDECTSTLNPPHLWTSCEKELYFICLALVTVLFGCWCLSYYISEQFIIAQIKCNSRVVFNYFTKPKSLIMSSLQYQYISMVLCQCRRKKM